LESKNMVSQSLSAVLEEAQHVMTERVAIASGLEENPRLWGLLIGDADFTHRAGDRGLVFSRNGPGLIAGRHGVNSVPLIDAATGCLSVTILEDCPREVRQGLAEFLAEQGYLSAPKNLMVRALGSPQTFTRRDFSDLFRWRHLLAASAYKWIAAMAAAVDETRNSIQRQVKLRSARHTTALNDYHNVVSSLRLLMSLSSTATGAPWLRELATLPRLKTWTPSLFLSRERMLVPAIQSALAATWMGLAAVDVYFARLENSTDRLTTFDAVLGLASFAISYSEVSSSILPRVKAALTELELSVDKDFVRALMRSFDLAVNDPLGSTSLLCSWIASGTLTEPVLSQGVKNEMASRFATVALREYADAATTISGYFLAILALRLFMADRPHDFYPEGQQRSHGTNFAAAKTALLRSNNVDIRIETAATPGTYH
jgi:hypothetical protein